VRILLLSQFFPPIVGGEERHVRNLANALAGRGHQVSVATLWYPGAKPREWDGKVRVHRLRGTLQRMGGLFRESERRHAPPFPDPELVAGLHTVMREEKPDVVHAHNWLLASFLPLKLWSEVPLVVTLHDYSLVCAKKNFMHEGRICDGASLSRCMPCAAAHYGAIKGAVTSIGNFASRVMSRRGVDRFIAVSHAVARYNGLEAAGVPYRVIPNFVPDDVASLTTDTHPELEQLPREPFLLFVGDLMHLKGVDVLLTAYGQLAAAPPLVLIGRVCPDTPAERPPNVHVFSMWPHEAVMHAWRRCLFGILPSVGPEACATVIMEAMASGKPVIASDIGGMPDLVDEGETGMLVAPGDVGALRDAIQHLLADRQLLEAMGTNALSRVNRLKARAVVTQIEQTYDEVCREKRATGPRHSNPYSASRAAE